MLSDESPSTPPASAAAPAAAADTDAAVGGDSTVVLSGEVAVWGTKGGLIDTGLRGEGRRGDGVIAWGGTAALEWWWQQRGTGLWLKGIGGQHWQCTARAWAQIVRQGCPKPAVHQWCTPPAPCMVWPIPIPRRRCTLCVPRVRAAGLSCMAVSKGGAMRPASANSIHYKPSL